VGRARRGWAAAAAAARRGALAAAAWLNAGAAPDAALYVFLAYAAYRLVFGLAVFNAMAVPEFDFFEFRGFAATFSRLEVPEYFKRAPLYPVLMALWPFRFGGADRFLQGAEAANLAAGVATLAFLYRWGRGVLGRAAVLAVILAGTCWLYPQLMAQPLCEITLLFFVVATVAAAGKGSPWAYVAAGCAALTRYEGLALIPLAWLADVGAGHRRPRFFLYAALAAVPVGAWLAAGMLRTAAVNPYVDMIATLPPVGWSSLATTAADLFPPWVGHLGFAAYVFAAVALLGIGSGVARGDWGWRVYAAFMAAYLGVHFFYPFTLDRFVFPIFPLLAAGLVNGGRLIMARLGGLVRGDRGARTAAIVVAALWLAVAAVSFWSRRGEPFLAAGGPWAAALAFLAVGAWAAWRGIGGRRLLGAALTLAVLTFFVNAHVRRWTAEYTYFRWHGASVRATAAWLARVAPDQAKVCTAWPGIVAFYAGPGRLETMTPAQVQSNVRTLFPFYAARQNVAYIVYDSLSTAGVYVTPYFAAHNGVGDLAPFGGAADVGRYRYLWAVRTPGEFVYVYRLAAEPEVWEKPYLCEDENWLGN